MIIISANDAINIGGCLRLYALVSPGNVYWADAYTGPRCRNV